ncbi:hypothetical protein BLNAU_16321 [Blattamonas nauphoetae]|uniref:Uncharacterized protein n=1 Tax=Blattamonas nauphoetae TaxID=2049346 RepID=A0ABQ9X8F2_9EUKA|nr:hypothetical protein BLNAU_16321 [Blattamonas nauphoetae]
MCTMSSGTVLSFHHKSLPHPIPPLSTADSSTREHDSKSSIRRRIRRGWCGWSGWRQWTDACVAVPSSLGDHCVCSVCRERDPANEDDEKDDDDGLESIDGSFDSPTLVHFSSSSPFAFSFTFTLASSDGRTANGGECVGLEVNQGATGTLLMLADNSASDRIEFSGHAPNIARLIHFVFVGTRKATSIVSIGRSSFVQHHLDQYFVTAVALTGYAVSVPGGVCLPFLPTLVSASCSLDEFEQNAVVSLELRTESIGVHTVTLNTSPPITLEVEFKTGKMGMSEPTPVSVAGATKKLSPDTTYEIKSVTRKSDGLIVLFHPVSIKFTVPTRSCLTNFDPIPVYSNLDKQVSVGLEGFNLVGTHAISFSANGSSDAAFVGSVVFGSDWKGSMSGILFDTDSSKVNLKYDTRYDVIGVMKNGFDVDFVAGLTFTTMKEPTRLVSVGVPVDKNDRNSTTISLTGHAAVTGPYKLDLENSQNSMEKVTISATFTSADGGEAHATLYPIAQLKYGQTYKVTGMVGKMPSPPKIHVEAGLTVSIGVEPSRLTGMSATSPQDKQKEVRIGLTGIKMTNGPFAIALNGSKTITGTFAADGVTGSSTVILFSTKFRKQSNSTPLFFEPNSIEIIPEPPRLISINSTNNDIFTTTTLTLNATQLVAGNVYRLTFAETPRSSPNTEPTSPVSIDITASETAVIATQLNLYPSSTAVLKYGCKLSVLSMTAKTESTPILIETADCVFDTPIEPTRIESGSATLNSQQDTATIVVTGRELKVGTYSIFLESGAESFSTTATTTTKGELSFTAPTESSSDPSKVLFGLVYSFKTVKLNGSDVIVNLDASVEIPVPPKMSGVSVSPNTIGTGLWIGVTGSDLPVGETFNLAVVSGDSTFSFPITFSDSTTGSSEKQRLGWTDSLQFSTTYTVTSFTKLGDENAKIVILTTHTLDTPAKPVNLILYSESKSTDSSAFCGEIAQPCSSVDDAWRVVKGIGIERVAIEINDASSLTSPMRVQGGMAVLLKNGGMKEPNLNVGDFTPTTAQPGLGRSRLRSRKV